MPDSDVQQPDLEQLAVARFGPLSSAEINLVRASPKGETAYCGPSEEDNDPDNDPVGSDAWGEERWIRAGLVRWLCVDRDAVGRVDPRGVIVHAALIKGELDLSFVIVPFFLGLIRCSLSDQLVLRFIEIPSLDISGTRLPSLDAEHALVRGSVSLRGVTSEGAVQLNGARVGGNLECDGGRFQGKAIAGTVGIAIALKATNAKVMGDVLLRNGFAEGKVLLNGAEIGGSLDCGGGKFQSPAIAGLAETGTSLQAEGAKVARDVLFRNGFAAEGGVRLLGAHIGGNLDCDGGKFQNPAKPGAVSSGMALNAGGVNVGRSVFLRRGFAAEGQVRLYGARIGGNLEFDGGQIQNPAKPGADGSGIAIEAANVNVTGQALLRSGFVAEGSVSLYAAQIGGSLDCSSGKFLNPAAADVAGSGTALNAENATVAGDILLRGGFTANGEVWLYGAEVGGNLDCHGGKFHNPILADVSASGVALRVEGASVAGAVFFCDGFTAEGLVRLYGSHIGGNLSCDGGRFQNPAQSGAVGGGTALNAEAVSVARAVHLRKGFVAEGGVRLFGARIGGNLECDGGQFQNPAKAGTVGSGIALDASNANVTGHVHLRRGFSVGGLVLLYAAEVGGNLDCQAGTFDGLNLSNASAGAILDDEASWPKTGELLVDGFVYGRIAGGPVAATKRLAWLARQPSFARQPYRQLAKVLKEAGDDKGWRRVCAEMEARIWGKRSWVFQPWGYLLRGTISYGYSSLRALWLLLALVIVGWVVYAQGYEAGLIVPTGKDAYDSITSYGVLPGYYEDFHALPYSLENSFPLVRFGVQDKWVPARDERAAARQPVGRLARFLLRVTPPRFLEWFRWFQICAGWILATLFVAGVSGITRKD